MNGALDAAATPRVVVLRLRIIYLAMAAGVALLAGVGAFVARGRLVEGPGGDLLGGGLGFLVVGAIAGGAVVVDRAVWAARRARLRGRSPAPATSGELGSGVPTEILRGFQEASIVRAALIEAPCLLAAVLYLVSGEEGLLLAVGVGLALFVITLPSVERLRRFAESARGPS